MWAGRKDPPGPWLDPPVVSSPGLSWETFGHWKVWPKAWHSMTPLGFPVWIGRRGRKERTEGVSASPGPDSTSSQQAAGLDPAPPPLSPAKGSPSPKLAKTKMHSIPLRTEQMNHRVLLDR